MAGSVTKRPIATSTAPGPGSTKSGRCRAVAHHSTMTSTTAPSAISRGVATSAAPLRTRESPVKPRLDRTKEDDLGGGDEQQNEEDDREDRHRVEFLPRNVKHVANAAVAAEQLRRQHDLPRHAEDRTQRGEQIRQQQRYDHLAHVAIGAAREAVTELDQVAVKLLESRPDIDDGERQEDQRHRKDDGGVV